MSYVTWEYYSSLFSKVTKEEFGRLAERAGKRINLFTGGRAGQFLESYDADTATCFQRRVYEALLLTTCGVVDKLQIQEASGAGSGLASVSNDGYTESYKVTTEAERQAELDAVIRSGLSGTGLGGAL